MKLYEYFYAEAKVEDAKRRLKANGFVIKQMSHGVEISNPNSKLIHTVESVDELVGFVLGMEQTYDIRNA